MIRIACAAMTLACGSTADAAGAAAESPGQIRFLQELRVDAPRGGTRVGVDLQWLSPQRFIKAGMEWERDAAKRPLRPRYRLLDVEQGKMVEVTIPLDELPRTHVELLGAAPAPELVHHDGATTALLFKETRASKKVAVHLCRFDHRTRRFSELVKLGPLEDRRYLQPIGFDPQEEHFYFAFELYGPAKGPNQGPLTLELGRVGLRGGGVDWQMTLDLPQRKRQLGVPGRHFSHDGRKLALIEHGEKSFGQNPPQQQVYLIDIERRSIDRYPAPLGAYGATFTRDDRYLLLGSNDTGEIVRIDLEKKRVDLRAKGVGLIHGLALTPSGKSFLVLSNTILASPKVVEVRRVDTLGLKVSIPVRLLYPGIDGINAELASTQDGRRLVSPIVEKSGFPAGNGVRIYEVPDDVDSPATAGTTPEELRAAQAVVLAKLHAVGARIEVNMDPDEEARTPRPSFSPVVVAPGGDILLAGTRSGNTDGDYKPGRTSPVVVRLDRSGKKRWEVALAKKGFLDHTGARVAATSDGGCVAQVYSHVHPGRYPNTRLVKLDGRGKTLWEVQFRGDGDLDTPLGDRFELLADGSISISGRIYTAKDVKKSWSAVVSGAGAVLSDAVGD
jgi:hypothetical protein